MAKIVPILIVVTGPLLGAAVGIFLAPGDNTAAEAPHAQAAESNEVEPHEAEAPTPESGGHGSAPAAEFEYVKIPQQFVVPVIIESKVSAMVVISISLEITPGMNEAVFAREPKLRDTFLQVMFTHAQSGGFNGSFTVGQAMDDFRESLQQAAVEVLGDIVNAVLLTDIVRQDV